MGRQGEDAIGGIKRSWRRALIGCGMVRDARALGLVAKGTVGDAGGVGGVGDVKLRSLVG